MTINDFLFEYDHATPARKAFLKATGKKAIRLWGANKHCRRSWLAQTITLLDSGKHALLTGGFKTGSHERL